MHEQDFEELKKDILLEPLKSPEELQNWVYVFFDIFLPMGHIYHESNSSSVEFMWKIYCAVRDNLGQYIPSFTLLASRDSYKTLSASILEILLMLHFRTTIAHCAAIESQSQKAVEYCTMFINMIMPYLKAHEWKRTSFNKRRIELTIDKKQMCYIQIIILTVKGANSAHTNVMFIDEVDLCDPKAYQEAKMIPGALRGQFPLTIRLSTRKYAFGLMEKEVKAAEKTGSKVLRWNLIDVCEYCPSKRCRPDLPKIKRYIPRELPLRQLSPEEFAELEEKDKNDWEEIDAYQGCTGCKLLSVCKKTLHDIKPRNCVGDLWKPIDSIINTIMDVDPDVGEAQLLCHKPSSKGLIYGRFNELYNVLTVQQAWEMISGLKTPCNFNTLIQYIKDLGIKIEAGVDWGYTNEYAIIITAFLPGGQSIILDTFAAPDYELDDCVQVALELQEQFGIQKFWCDPAYPAYVKTFNRKGLISPKFVKDVPMGIEAVRGRIVDAGNRRWMYILKTPNNERLITGMGTYHWKIDAQGNATDKPDHTDESDIMDGKRYLYQNVYGKKGKIYYTSTKGAKSPQLVANKEKMEGKIKELATSNVKSVKLKSKKRIFWM
jgi:hypothetical protein